MEIQASPAAVQHVERHGGRPYVWLDDFGGVAIMKAAVEDPGGGRVFEETSAARLRVLLERGEEFPARARLSLRRWPRRRLDIVADTGLRPSAVDFLPTP